MAEEFDIYDVTVKYLDSLTNSDLYDLGRELNQAHDRNCTWAWRMEVSEEMWMRAESALCAHTPDAILRAMEWAQSVKGFDWLDEDGDPVTEDELLERARYNIGEMADIIIGDSWEGVPDTYMVIDSDELLAEWQKTTEWQEEYGDYDGEEDEQ